MLFINQFPGMAGKGARFPGVNTCLTKRQEHLRIGFTATVPSVDNEVQVCSGAHSCVFSAHMRKEPVDPGGFLYFQVFYRDLKASRVPSPRGGVHKSIRATLTFKMAVDRRGSLRLQSRWPCAAFPVNQTS